MPSCPDCLRSWDNRRHHSGLDWRLALDMLDLAAGEPLAMQRWMPLGLGLAEKVRDNVLAGWPIQLEEVLGVPVLRHESRALVIGHPLWWRGIGHEAELQAEVNAELGAQGLQLLQTDPFEMEFRTARVLRDLIGI